MRCYLWSKCVHEPNENYEGGKMKVFDYVEVIGIGLFEMDRMLEKEANVYGDKKNIIFW